MRWVNRATSSEQYVDWVSGAALLVYRADAEAAGLLDERYFLYTEDVDFCAAIRARGRRCCSRRRRRSRTSRPLARDVRAHERRLPPQPVAFYEKHHPLWAPIVARYLR